MLEWGKNELEEKRTPKWLVYLKHRKRLCPVSMPGVPVKSLLACLTQLAWRRLHACCSRRALCRATEPVPIYFLACAQCGAPCPS